MTPPDVEAVAALVELTLPYLATVHVDGDHLSVAEPRVHTLPVGHRTGAGEVVFVVYREQPPLGRDLVLPEQSPVLPPERSDYERDAIIASPGRIAHQAFV